MCIRDRYNTVHIEKRNHEIALAYEKYAPRYEGDDEYDVGAILSKLQNDKV